MSTTTRVGSNACFGGSWQRYKHDSECTKTPMTFSVFVPPAATPEAPAPCIFYLSGLTCTDENFVQKAGAARTAAERGVALVAPDTSPRGAGVDGEDDAYDFGSGAGFYVDATAAPWRDNYNMYSYVTDRAAKESEIPNFKGSDLGRFPHVSADFWTNNHPSERPRSVDASSGTRARGTPTLKRR